MERQTGKLCWGGGTGKGRGRGLVPTWEEGGEEGRGGHPHWCEWTVDNQNVDSLARALRLEVFRQTEVWKHIRGQMARNKMR